MRRLIRFALLGGTGILIAGCATPAQNGALGGGAVGAGLGAIIGGASGNAGVGALIGAGAGAATGALIGDQVDHDRYADHTHYGPPRAVYYGPPPPPVYYGPPPPPPVYYAPAPPPAPAAAPSHFSQSYRVNKGHYETRLLKGASGEYYEERVWVP